MVIKCSCELGSGAATNHLEQGGCWGGVHSQEWGSGCIGLQGRPPLRCVGFLRELSCRLHSPPLQHGREAGVEEDRALDEQAGRRPVAALELEQAPGLAEAGGAGVQRQCLLEDGTGSQDAVLASTAALLHLKAQEGE